MKRFLTLTIIIFVFGCATKEAESVTTVKEDVAVENMVLNDNVVNKTTVTEDISGKTVLKPVVQAVKPVKKESVIAVTETTTQSCEKHLFYISKSDNKNTLYYDANIVNGELNDTQPVKIYWVMHSDKNQVEELTFLEKPQFDIKFRTVEKGKKYIVNINNDKLTKKDVTVAFDKNGCVIATASIAGQHAILRDVFIKVIPGIFVPDVPYLDVNGIANGAVVTERVNNK